MHLQITSFLLLKESEGSVMNIFLGNKEANEQFFLRKNSEGCFNTFKSHFQE